MARHNFQLEPFSSRSKPGLAFASPAITIVGWVERAEQEGLLVLHYELEGDLKELEIPAPSARPKRCDGLWQTTCLEWFGAAGGLAPYWECNLSPSGDWNLYRIADYRQELEKEKNSPTPAFTVVQGANSLSLDLRCPLPAGLVQAQPLELGICAVIEQRPNSGPMREGLGDASGEGAGLLSYWALAHPGPRADFHLRQGWTLRL